MFWHSRRRRIQPHGIGKIEKGDPGVAMGHYSTVLFVMGMADRLGDLVDPKNDNVGFSLKKSGCRSGFALRERRERLSNGMRKRSFMSISTANLMNGRL